MENMDDICERMESYNINTMAIKIYIDVCLTDILDNYNVLKTYIPLVVPEEDGILMPDMEFTEDIDKVIRDDECGLEIYILNNRPKHPFTCFLDVYPYGEVNPYKYILGKNNMYSHIYNRNILIDGKLIPLQCIYEILEKYYKK